MRLIPALFSLLLAILALWFGPFAARGEVSPLGKASTLSLRELGAWDDVFACGEQEMLLLRRGAELYSLSMARGGAPDRLCSAATLEGTEIVACKSFGKRVWAFLNSTQRHPFAIEVTSGERVDFEVPGVDVAGKRPPGIQSHIFPGTAGGAFLMISGGDAATWPREGNRPMYFWMSLATGQMVAFPAGWDLDHFSVDHRLALFAKPIPPSSFERTPFQVVDVSSGRLGGEIWYPVDTPVTPFDWGNTDPIQVLHLRRWVKESSSESKVAGLVIEGRPFRFDLPAKGSDYLAAAKANDGFAGLRVRGNGSSAMSPSPLRLFPLIAGGTPQTIATNTIDFEMLGQGNCVAVTAGHGHLGKSSEAFVFHRASQTQCNVLQDADRLPPLEAEFADKPYIQDELRIRLIGGFGAPSSRATLCLFDQYREDARSLPGGSLQLKPRLLTQFWNRAIIVSHDGHRYTTDAFRHTMSRAFNQIWFHSSGKVWTTKYEWQPPRPDGTRKKVLSEITFQLP